MPQNRLTQLFAGPKRNLLSVYATAGYPNLNDIRKVLCALEAGGVDLIEVGVPFSDSLVDGPTIQACNEQALKNGMSVQVLFEQLQSIRSEVNVPLVLMSCLNPLLQFGMEEMCKACAACGIDGLIIPDLPLEDYRASYREMFEAHNLSAIFLLTSRSTPERIQEIDELSSAFIYAVSSEAVTGAALALDKGLDQYLQQLSALKLKNPIMLGFGIHDRKGFARAAAAGRGAIIGSAFMRALGGAGSLQANIANFLQALQADT